jgi:hypothetical protein
MRTLLRIHFLACILADSGAVSPALASGAYGEDTSQIREP